MQKIIWLILLGVLGQVGLVAEVVPELQELTVLVSSQDLYLDRDEILVNVGGMAYPALSLEKQGSGWRATVARVNYCPGGHLTCTNCGQCHTERCWYYVRHCNLWK